MILTKFILNGFNDQKQKGSNFKPNLPTKFAVSLGSIVGEEYRQNYGEVTKVYFNCA